MLKSFYIIFDVSPFKDGAQKRIRGRSIYTNGFFKGYIRPLREERNQLFTERGIRLRRKE